MGLGGSALGFSLNDLIWLFPAFALAWIFLRQPLLALAVALAPLPAMAISARLQFQAPHDYFYGFCVGLLLSGALLRRFLGLDGGWQGVLWAAAGACAIVVIGSWQAALDLALCAAAATGVVFATFRYLPLDEGFVARANRAAEARARLTEIAARIIAAPRWALAISGIGVVLAALGWFQIGPPHAPDYPELVVAAAAAFLLSRDWRAALSAILCIALLWLFRADAPAFFMLPGLVLAAGVRGRVEEGGEAWLRSLEDEGTALLFAAAGAAMASLRTLLDGDAPNPMAAILAYAAALILYPALVCALWNLFPRRRSVEEMYRG